ncbi:MAG: hypothetical protein WC915_05715 [archaeon]|jgi:hypothetical protein
MKTKIISLLLVMMLVLTFAFAEDNNANDSNANNGVEEVMPVLIAEAPTDANEEGNIDANIDVEVSADSNTDIEVSVDANVDAEVDTNLPQELETTDAETELEEEVASEAIDQETQVEIALMQDSLGAKVRVLQLQHAALKSYLVGNEVIAILTERADVSEMQAIQAEISLLKDEAFALDENSETAVADFVAIKRDLRASVSQFRSAVNSQLTVEEKATIRANVSVNEELIALNQTIKETIREHNASKVKSMLGKMNVNNQEVINKIKAGELTLEQIRNRVKEEYKQLQSEEKELVKQEFAAKINAQEKILETKRENIVKNYIEVQKERIQNRLEQLSQEQKEKLQANKDQMIQKLNQVKESLQQKNQELTQVRINNRIQSKIAGGIQ